MDLSPNQFKRAIKSGQQQIGLWCSLASHISAEMLSASGFDWLLLDTEHSPNEIPMVFSQLQAVASGGPAHPVVRIPWNDTVVIKRFLDAGVQTLLIPNVQTEEEARQAVAATRYPPLGVRGFASASRSSRYGRIKDYHTRCHEEICVVVQIETQLALENLEAIARVEGVDGLFVGPGDLSADLGHVGDQSHPAGEACDRGDGRAHQEVRQHSWHPDRGRRPCAPRDRARLTDHGGGFDIGLLARSSEALAARFKS